MANVRCRTATAQFVSGGQFEAKQRTVYNGMDWYMVQPEAAIGNPPSWVPVSSPAAVLDDKIPESGQGPDGRGARRWQFLSQWRDAPEGR